MSNLRLVLVCPEYDRVIALKTGDVKPNGIDLVFERGTSAHSLERLTHDHDLDLAEISLGQYVTQRSRNVDAVVAIPVFPLRMFRLGDLFVRNDSALSSMSELRGKRVGLKGYTTSSNVWTRGMLQHDFGVAPHEVDWFEGGTDEPSPPWTQPQDVPAGTRLTYIGPERLLVDMLEAGEIDVLSPSWPPQHARPGGPVRRMYPDYPEHDRAYYRKSGIWPIQHTIGIRREVADANPWVIESLMAAFDEAVQFWKGRMREHHCLLPWAQLELDEHEEFFGHDLYGNGLGGNNRHNIETFLQYAHEQGLGDRRVSVEELFPPDIG